MPAESMKMANKLAFIDLDGVVANCDARFALADSIASSNFPHTSKDWARAKWHNVFMPDRVSLDTLIPGAYEAIRKIAQEYTVIYLTSRPEHMREATTVWLKSHGLYGMLEQLFMKPAPFTDNFAKTVPWKAGTIHQIAYAYSATEVLVIDDETMNLDELQKYTTPFAMKYYTSLAMEDHEDLDDIRPF